MKTQKQLTIAIAALSVVLVILLGILIAREIAGPAENGPAQIETPSSSVTSVPTETQASTVPTQSEPVVTEPPETQAPTVGPTEYAPDMDELIGTLYTRAQLAAIDGTRLGYGPGKSVNGNRPPHAVNAQRKYNELYDAWFIGPDNGKIYFTFCHGYEQNNLTGIVLDALKEKGVKAVFFINKDYARLAPEMVWRMINEGHIVANHATKHPDMGTLSVDRIVEEIMVMHNYMVENFGYEMKLFRPPSGYYSARVLAVAQSLGYTTVQYSYTYLDWDRGNPPDYDKFRAGILDSAHSGAIYYFHTVTPSGVSAICDSIDALRAKGYEFALFTGEFE